MKSILLSTVALAVAALSEIPRYRCHKVVGALKIAAVKTEYVRPQIEVEDAEIEPIEMPAEWVAKHQPQAGGYLVIYEDGYVSYSPAAAFEGGYMVIEEGEVSYEELRRQREDARQVADELGDQLTASAFEMEKLRGDLVSARAEIAKLNAVAATAAIPTVTTEQPPISNEHVAAGAEQFGPGGGGMQKTAASESAQA